jgi:hypothetical protein
MPQIPTLNLAQLAALPAHPVILRGHQPALACQSLREFLAATGWPTLSAYRDGQSYDYVELAAPELLAAFESGAFRLNVAASYLPPEADPNEALTVPAVIDRGNLFNCHPPAMPFRKSAVITQAGGFTRMHVDSYGMGGWMYLYAGRKAWHLWAPAHAPLFYNAVADWYFDAAAGDPHPDPDCRAALESLPRWEGEIGPGELLWFPGGWLHRVWTLADSFGFGGSSLHAERLDQAVESWLWERRMGFTGSIDYPALLRDAARHGHPTQHHAARIEERLASWAAARP